VYFIGHSAKTVFAECQIKYTRQKKTRQNVSLPSAFFLALGKDVFCRVLFFGTRQNASLPSAFFLTLGKDVFCQVLFLGTRQNASLPSAFFLALSKDVFCRVPLFWHSAKRHFAMCISFPSANQFFKAIFEALNEFK